MLNFNLLKSYWWVIFILLVGGTLMTKECPPNCIKSGPLGLGCECHSGSVRQTGVHTSN